MTLPVSSSHSTAILVSDQSHQGPPFLAPPSSLAVSGPSSRRRANTSLQVLSFSCSTCQRLPFSRLARRLNAYAGQSSSGSTQAAWDQYSNVSLFGPQ